MTFAELLERGVAAAQPEIRGRVRSITGLTVWVDGIDAAVGDLIHLEGRHEDIPAEVIGAEDGLLACLPIGPTIGIGPGTTVRSIGDHLMVPVGDQLLGRVLDGIGRPIDGGAPLDHVSRVRLENSAPQPLGRQRVNQPIQLGIRAIDTMIPVGRGQRLGIFAGSGVGKSTLLSMIARNTTADVVVAALVGERGREVREFIEADLGPEGLARSVVVVATSDQPPVVRLRAAFAATRIAEYFRDQGKDVLLFMDSVTRAAMAQREVGLSAGEPPATRGYPPSVFAMLPQLLERAGAGETGTITGLYTVLVEGDDMQDPIGDAARSILDGHIVLDRDLANSGHFPAIDVLGSVSRVAPAITTPDQRQAASRVRSLMAAYRDVRILLEIGAYVPGSDPLVDRAVALMPQINAFLQQGTDEYVDSTQAWTALEELAGQL